MPSNARTNRDSLFQLESDARFQMNRQDTNLSRAGRSSGFTLIEILVVVLIVGITLGFALMAFGDFGEKRRIIVAAEQFSAYVKLVQQEAILQSNTLGITINTTGYQTVQFQAPDTWTLPSPRHAFRSPHFPKGLVVTLQRDAAKRGVPAIIISSSGDMTPFTLEFGSTKQINMMTIVGESNGTMHRIKSP